MNKRIIELARQANSEIHALMFMEYRTFESKLYERFAELIIEECAEFVSSAVEVHTQAEQDACIRASKGLKNYFGVK